MKISRPSKTVQSSPGASAEAAFTLIELLVVISIIAILAGLLFPAMGMVREQAKKTSARNDIVQLTTAVRQYYTDYGKYPNVTGATASTDIVVGGDTASGLPTNYDLINILRYQNSKTDQNVATENPRGVTYLDGLKTVTAGAQTNGVDTTGNWQDPWGTPYVVFIDNDYDGDISVDKVYKDSTFTSNGVAGKVRTGVGAASFGKDKSAGKNKNNTYVGSDDLITWQ